MSSLLMSSSALERLGWWMGLENSSYLGFNDLVHCIITFTFLHFVFNQAVFFPPSFILEGGPLNFLSSQKLAWCYLWRPWSSVTYLGGHLRRKEDDSFPPLPLLHRAPPTTLLLALFSLMQRDPVISNIPEFHCKWIWMDKRESQAMKSY